MFFRVDESPKKVVFYNSSAIEEFGPISWKLGGLTVRVRQSATKLVEVFVTIDQLDEMYSDLDVRQNAKLLRTGYTPKAVRERNRRSLKNFLNS